MDAGKTAPQPPAAAEETEGILTLDRLAAGQSDRTKRVFVKEVGAEIVVQKLPAAIIAKDDLGEISPMVLALTEGVAEPKITEEFIEKMTFEQATAIYAEVEKFNPGVIGDGAEEVAAENRKKFPS